MDINRKNNFDLIRLLAAIVVLIAHVASKSQYPAFLTLTKIFNSKVAVDSFFIISGFLIFRSFENSSSLKSYIQKRAKRILPAYVAVIVIFAFALYFVSSVSFREYFNIEFVKYIFFNLITLNFLQSTLPGVFVDNPQTAAVNDPLWTIKVEIMFYIVVPFIAYILHKTNKVFAIAAIYLLSILYSAVVVQLTDLLSPEMMIQLEQQLPGQIAFFISGAFLYYFYDRFKYNVTLLLPIATLIVIVHNLVAQVYFLYPLALAVIVIYFCLIFKCLGNFGKYGDFSYGIYIWHFPILQIFTHFRLFDHLWLGVPSVLACVFLVSYLSWHLIEKPFLARKSHYVVAEAKEKDLVVK